MDENISNCWEYWKCSEETKMICPVFEKKAGGMCWVYVGGARPFVDRGFDNCGACPWFKKKSPQVYDNNH